jgi:hypothetical protein
MSGKKILFLCLFFLLAFGTNAQSLLQDARNLVDALDLVNNPDKHELAIQAKMSDAITDALRKYDRGTEADTSTAVTGLEILGPFAQQGPVSELLATSQALFQLVESRTFDMADAAALQNDLRSILELQTLALHQLGLEINDAKAKALAILYTYTQILPGDSVAVSTWPELLDQYDDNVLFDKLINPDAFNLQDSISTEFSEKVHTYIQEITSGPREQILELLHARNAVSPADYLSVPQALEEYSIPPVPQALAISVAAQESNANVRNGFLINEAEIIEGLFKFVLERAKKEVVINFLEEMVDSTEHPNLLALFPTVVQEFSDQEFYYSSSYIERMRQAFYADFQKLTIRLPLLMLEDEYFKPLQGDPVAYDLLTIYSMVGMSQRGETIDEIIPVTHRFLYDGYGEASKETNFTVAEKGFGKQEYDSLITIANQIKGQLKAIYIDLDNAESTINENLNTLKSRFGSEGAPLGNDYLGNSSFDLKVLLGDATEGNEWDLFLWPSLLAGELDSVYVAGFNTLSGYDKFFKDEKSALQWRAAGLELSRKLSGTWYQDKSIAGILMDWQNGLVRFQEAVDDWVLQVDTTDLLDKAKASVEQKRKRLLQTAIADKQFWADSIGLSHDQEIAFDLLATLVGNNAFTTIDFDPNYFIVKMSADQVARDKIQRKRTLLSGVEERLVALDQRMRDIDTTFFYPSPLQLFLLEKDMTSTPYGFIIPRIKALEDALTKLNKQLMVVDRKFAPTESKARDNAKPVLQVTEAMTQLLYGLRTDSNEEDQKWLNKEQVSEILDGGEAQNVFLGLLAQRLEGVKEIGKFSTKGVAQLIQLTVAELDNLPAFLPVQDSLAQQDSLSFFRKAAFAVNTMNRVLQLPLVVDPNNPGTFEPLTDRFYELSKVPDISTQALDFIYYINVRNHAKAVSSLIQLFTSLDYETVLNAPGLTQQQIEHRTNAIEYLKKYGNFIAGMIDAEKSDQVKDLLDNIADPPGSSRTKRTNDITVGLNAFLGANVGNETWSGDQLSSDDNFTSVAPSMPFGFAISGLIGKKKPQSFSLFLSLIDLGGLFSYRLDADAIGENNINFRNVFKPGFQVQWNLKKSPFYLSAGSHFGPTYRNLNDELISLNSKRFFVGFGIDVPVFTFYTRK